MSWFLSSALGVVVAGASIACLLGLPGRSSQVARFDVSELARPAEAAGFSLGPLYWDMHLYGSDPALEPLRAFFRAQCVGESGLGAARCLASRFAAAFPSGAPSHEFVDARYDPVADLEAHMRGEPGHCVTRSGLVTAILLSVSIPARQAQIAMLTRVGHNILEVWDARWGWVAVDPQYERVAARPDGRPESLGWALFHRPRWEQFDRPIDDSHFYDELDRRRRGGDVALAAFPDPWLYTRVGTRRASWPFRGLFADTAGTNFRLGPAQFALRWSAALSMAISVACALLGWMRQRRSRVAQVAAILPTPTVVQTDAGVLAARA